MTDGVRVKINGSVDGPQHPPKELQPHEGNGNSLGWSEGIGGNKTLYSHWEPRWRAIPPMATHRWDPIGRNRNSSTKIALESKCNHSVVSTLASIRVAEWTV